MKIRMLTTYASPKYHTHNADSIWPDCPDDIAEALIEAGSALRIDAVAQTPAEVLDQAMAALEAANAAVAVATSAVELHEVVVAEATKATEDEEPTADASVKTPEGEERKDALDGTGEEAEIETATAKEDKEDADAPEARPRRRSRS